MGTQALDNNNFGKVRKKVEIRMVEVRTDEGEEEGFLTSVRVTHNKGRFIGRRRIKTKRNKLEEGLWGLSYSVKGKNSGGENQKGGLCLREWVVLGKGEPFRGLEEQG